MRASTVVLTSVAAAAAASVLWLGLQLSGERARNDALSAELLALRQVRGARPVESELAAPPATPEPRSATSAALTAPANAVARVEAEPESQPNPRGRDFNESRRRLMSNPEYRKVMRAQQRLMIEQRYRDLPRALGLSAEKTGRLLDLLADQSMSAMDGGLRRGKSHEEMLAQGRIEGDRQRAYEAQITELLGESGMAGLRDFRESMQSRAEVRMLGNELVGSSDPLREDQMEPLFDVMYTEQKRLAQEWNDLAMSGQSGPKMSAKRSQAAIAANERIVDAARSLLSGPQLRALEEMYRRQKTQMQLRDEMNRLTTEAGSRPAPARTD